MSTDKILKKNRTENTVSAEKSLLRKMFDLSESEGQKYFDIFAFSVLALLTVWCVVNMYYSTGFSVDEAFYLTIPKRILAGDGLLTDEWQLSQLSSVLLLPFVWLWYAIKDSAEGMYMFFAVLFCVVRGLFCCTVYALMRKYRYFSLLAAACLSQYATLNYNSLSYNTIGLFSAVLLMCLCVRLSEKPDNITTGICGALYAVLILCNPVALALFPAYCIAVAVFLFRKGREKNIRPNNKKAKKSEKHYLFTLRGFISFVIGILPVFIYFCIILFRNSSLKDIILSLPYIMQDPEHMVLADGSGENTVQGLGMLTELTDNLGIAVFIIAILLSVCCLVCKKFCPKICLPMATASVVILFVSAQVYYYSPAFETENPGLVYFAFSLEGVLLYFIGDRKNKFVFYSFICGGFFYAFCMEVSSNLGYQAHINGYIASLPGVMILLSDCLKNKDCEEKTNIINSVSVFVSLCFVFIALGFYSIGINGYVFFNRSDSIYEIPSGYYQGKKMERTEYSNYVFLKSDISALDELAEEGDKVLVYANLPQAYLETDKLDMATMSGWLFIDLQLQSDSAEQRFFAYYEMYPENTPDWIYIPFFCELADGTQNLYPKKILAESVEPYFSGEAIELKHGIAYKVDKIIYDGESVE